jgi:uncharacterized protein (TIGR00251 family)
LSVNPDLSTRLKLKVVPGASRSEVAGWLGDMLKVKVSAPPEKGKANVAVEALVAKTLNLPASSVKIVSGTSSQHKVIEIRGLSKVQIFQKLGSPAVLT